MNINWSKAREVYDVYNCYGLRCGTRFVMSDDPDRVLRCHETEIPIERWCDSCIGWKAVCEMDLAQQTLAIKTKMETLR